MAQKGITPEKDWQKRKFWNHFTWADADELRLHFIGGVHSRGHGWAWPGTQIAGSGVFKWNAADSGLLFEVGPHAARHPAHAFAGQLHFPVQVPGPVKGVIVEPRFTEKYVFSLYYKDAELWLDGTKIELQDTTGRGHKFFSDPIPMTAGRKTPIRLVWTATEGPKSEAHLNWESLSQKIEHVPQSALYPPDK